MCFFLKPCEGFVLVSQFVESITHFKKGVGNHALAVALRTFLLVQPLPGLFFELYVFSLR